MKLIQFTTLKFHSIHDGFIRLENGYGHLFDVTIPEDVKILRITKIQQKGTDNA